MSVTPSIEDLYRETIASQLKVWDAELETLEAKTDIWIAQAEDHFYTTLRSLRAKERELTKLLCELESGEHRPWAEMRDAVIRTTDCFKHTLEAAEGEFEQIALANDWQHTVLLK